MLSKVQLVYTIYRISDRMKFIRSRKIVHLNLRPTSIFVLKDIQNVASENEIKKTFFFMNFIEKI